jgi:hypothetical protein
MSGMGSDEPHRAAEPAPEEPLTAEFDLLSAGLEEPLKNMVETPNPRQSLSDEELKEHETRLREVAAARAGAAQEED